MSNINIYFEYQSTQVVQLPVNPEKLKIQIPGNNSTENVIALGEVSLLKLPKLSTLSFESFIPTINTGAYVQKDATIYSQQFYIDAFKAISNEKVPVNFVVSGLGVNMQVSVEDFSYWWEGSDPDMYYSVSLKEYKNAAVKTVTLKKASSGKGSKVSEKKKRANSSKSVTVGCTVKVNGRLHRDSYGNGPGKTEKNTTRKVNFIKKGRKCPYHVTTLEGGWRGWVSESSVEVVN